MSELPRGPASGDPGLPRWVKVSLLVAAILVVSLVLAALIVGGEHGPGRHGATILPVASASAGL